MSTNKKLTLGDLRGLDADDEVVIDAPLGQFGAYMDPDQTKLVLVPSFAKVPKGYIRVPRGDVWNVVRENDGIVEVFHKDDPGDATVTVRLGDLNADEGVRVAEAAQRVLAEVLGVDSGQPEPKPEPKPSPITRDFRARQGDDKRSWVVTQGPGYFGNIVARVYQVAGVVTAAQAQARAVKLADLMNRGVIA